MSWATVAVTGAGVLGGLLGGGKKIPDLSVLSKEERAKITQAAVGYFSNILAKKHLFSPGQLNSLLAPMLAINASNFLSSVRSATEVALGSGQGSRSGVLASQLNEASRSRTAADRAGANSLMQLEATTLPQMQMSSAQQLAQISSNDAAMAQGVAAQNSQIPSKFEAGLAGGLAAFGSSVGANGFPGGGGGGASLSSLPLSSGWNVGNPGFAPPSVGGGTQPGINLSPVPALGGGGYGVHGVRIQLPDGSHNGGYSGGYGGGWV